MKKKLALLALAFGAAVTSGSPDHELIDYQGSNFGNYKKSGRKGYEGIGSLSRFKQKMKFKKYCKSKS